MDISVLVRPTGPSDLPVLRALHLAAFPGPSEARLVELLHTAGKGSISLIAQLDQLIVGHAVFSPITLDPPNPHLRALGLGPIAVLPDYQRKGIGSLLITQGLDIATRQQVHAVFVLGNPAYYSRFGFTRASTFHFTNEYSADHHFMVAKLHPDALTSPGGLVRYAPEFALAGC